MYPLSLFCLFQDIGLQGYSTLHCIRFTGGGVQNVDMVTNSISKIKLDEVPLGGGTSETGEDAACEDSMR